MKTFKKAIPAFLKAFNFKLFAVILAMTLVFGGVVGGTFAWIIAAPEPVVNTFTYGDINIKLEETDTDLDGDNDSNTNEYKMTPGEDITKDPLITVEAGSEEMWLFVKIEESENFDTFMTYEVDGSWAELDGVDGVYYRHITEEEIAEEDMEISVIKDNKVTVKEDVTKEMLNELDKDGASDYPTLTLTAYAVQYAGNSTAADAWEKTTV